MEHGTGHTRPEAASIPSRRPMTQLQLAAMNLIADHEAGIPVDAVKLDFARRLLA